MPPASLPTTADVAARSLYTYYSAAHGQVAEDVAARSLYTYVNESAHGLEGQRVLNQNDVIARVLYLYANIVHDRTLDDVAARALYTYLAYTNDEIFPWIERIVPTEQSVGGQVEIMGDGFGDTTAAEGGSVRLGLYDPAVSGPGMAMGIVSWQTRSPNLYPANSGVRSTAAIVATVPEEAESGMVSVELTT